MVCDLGWRGRQRKVRHHRLLMDGLPSSAPTADHSPERGWWWALQVMTVVALALGTRTILLDSLPGEWYGDISTVHEYALDLRSGRHPPGWYKLGVGPLFPLWAWPFQALLGSEYLSLKAAAAAGSLAGLALLFVAARRLVDESFALVATAIASVGSWWLVYSRLGDVQGLTPTVALLAFLACLRAVDQPGFTVWSVLAGTAGGLGVYLYGNTTILPGLVAVTLLAAALGNRHRWSTWIRTAAGFVLGSAVLLPFALDAITRTEAVTEGHGAQRIELGWTTPGQIVEGYRMVVEGYVVEGDRNARGNPPTRTHVDRLGLGLVVVGVVWWCRPARRRRGALLVGWTVALHLPFALAVDNLGPSVSRTTAAAPFVYLLVSGGVWGCSAVLVRCVRWLRAGERSPAAATVSSRRSTQDKTVGRGATGTANGRRWSDTSTAGACAWALVAVLGFTNLRTYFIAYERNLPYGNTPVSAMIVRLARTHPAGTEVHVVGYGWAEGTPEPKSIGYQLGSARPLVEHDPSAFDCSVLSSLPSPSLVVWDHTQPLPSPALEQCADEFEATTHVAPSGRAAFRSLTVE